MSTIPQALRRIKGNLSQFLPGSVIAAAAQSLLCPLLSSPKFWRVKS